MSLHHLEALIIPHKNDLNQSTLYTATLFDLLASLSVLHLWNRARCFVIYQYEKALVTNGARVTTLAIIVLILSFVFLRPRKSIII